METEIPIIEQKDWESMQVRLLHVGKLSDVRPEVLFELLVGKAWRSAPDPLYAWHALS